MDKSNIPLPRHLNDFLDWLEIEKGLSSKTQENYSRFLKKFIVWLEKNNLKNLKPHELSPDHIWKYRAYLARQASPKIGKNLKKSTQNYYLIALRSLLNFFADRDILSLPSEKIKLARKQDGKVVSFLNLEQIALLLSTPDLSKVNGLRDRAILETLFSTGMRIAELTSLNREQVKIKPETKEIELTIIGKGSKARLVFFSETAINSLRKYLKERDKKFDQDKALFVNFKNKKGDSRRLTARAIQKSIKKYAILAGLPLSTTPHVMRHSFSTDLISKGIDLRILQEFLGHKSITATQIYAHVTNKHLRDIHRKFHGKKQ